MGIDKEIAAYERLAAQLERDHMGKWILMHNEKVVGMFESSSDAAVEAVTKFGRGPYLIRQIGAPPVIMPASVMFRQVHA